VYPAYVDAHREVFEKGDVERGEPSSKVEGLVVLESLKMEMNDVVKRCCEVLKEVAERVE
jgi:nicotinamide/nicotinate riboside kinase